MVLTSHADGAVSTWFGVVPWRYNLMIGFDGVELFFVLSGWLIGHLLIEQAAAPSWRGWRIFMVRRWMRTLPLYYLCVAVLAVFMPPEFWKVGHAALWPALPYYLTLTQNLGWPMVADWFSPSWSLVIEEWFYLTFSAGLLAFAVWLGRRWALFLTLGLFLAGPALFRYELPLGVDFGEYVRKIAAGRLDAIAFGVAAVWFYASFTPGREWRLGFLALGLVLLAALWGGWLPNLGYHAARFTRRVLQFDLTSLGLVACLPAAMADLPRLPGLLARAVRVVSAHAYSLYLVHLPILDMTYVYRQAHWLPAPLCCVVDVLAIAGLSAAAYRWVERPAMRCRPRQPPVREGLTVGQGETATA